MEGDREASSPDPPRPCRWCSQRVPRWQDPLLLQPSAQGGAEKGTEPPHPSKLLPPDPRSTHGAGRGDRETEAERGELACVLVS